MADFTALKQAACMDELQKIAGVASEGVMTALDFPFSTIPMGIGYLSGPKTKEQMIKQEGRGLSNVLSPFAAPYRLGRRLATPQLIRDAAKKEFDKNQFNKKKK